MNIVLAEPLTLLPIQNKAAAHPGSVGPGWFDSSWELRTGLQVEEGLPADLPLHGWLEGWLQAAGGAGGASPALSAT
jgi:hypothetical protein